MTHKALFRREVMTKLLNLKTRAVMALLLAPVTVGCGDFLDELIAVNAPDRVLREAVDDPGQADLLVASVQGAFECAFVEYTHVLGLLTDELEYTGGNGFIQNMDRRVISAAEGGFGFWASNDCDSYGVYTPVSSSRWFADFALEKLETWTDAEVDDRAGKIATVSAYAAYGLVLLGEGMCSAAIDLGPELMPAQIFQMAEQKFTSAMSNAQTAGADDILNLALVGRARTRLNLGLGAEAVSDAQAIPAGFVHNATYAGGVGSLRENRLYAAGTRNRAFSIAPDFRGLEWQGVPDPRVPVAGGTERGADDFGLWWFQTKYASLDAPVPLATWEEAQLIIAEVQGGQEAVNIITALHTAAGLPPFASTDPAEIADHVQQERARELFLESHRTNDIDRLSLPLAPPAGTAFPRGGEYGDARCLPLPDRERLNNPNI